MNNNNQPLAINTNNAIDIKTYIILASVRVRVRVS